MSLRIGCRRTRRVLRRSASSPADVALGWASACATLPKPLMEVAGEPFLVHQLRLLAAHGAREAVLCVGYLGELIEARIGAERFGIGIRYSFDGARAWTERSARCAGRCRCWVSASSCSNGDTYLRD